MQIKKAHLEVFFNTLKSTEGVLNLTESRIRDTFMKPLFEVTRTFIEDRENIFQNFCVRDEEKKPILLEGKKYQFEPSVTKEVENELNTLNNEEVELKPLYSAELKAILEKTTYSPKVGEVEIIDEILAKF